MERRSDPYPCRIVRHRGARRMTLRVGTHGVRLTVPPRTPARHIDAFLASSAAWVDAQSARLPPGPPPLRHGDRLAYLDGALDLVVRRTDRGRQGVSRDGGRIVAIPGVEGDLDALVESWYRREARAVIAPRAHRAAAAVGRQVAGLTIRDPRTRWGSCSSGGSLSFSWRLLLAPEHVLDYVVAHEVCHLVRPDHSPAFWALVAEAFPSHEAARDWLRETGPALHRGPAWRVSPA